MNMRIKKHKLRLLFLSLLCALRLHSSDALPAELSAFFPIRISINKQ